MRLVVAAITVLFPLAGVAEEDIPSVRQAELLYLLKHDCGSCHGLTLRGGLGPALTPQALAKKPPESLERAILDGRVGTPMPPWRGLLSESEARWLVGILVRGEVHAP